MDILAGLGPQVSNSDNPLREKTFHFLVCLMGHRDQLRINHWQTTSYAEHKMTDGLIGVLTGYIDSIGEAALGLFGRPTITMQSITVSDLSMSPSKALIDHIQKDVIEMLEEFKITNNEGIISLLGDLDAEVKTFKYLSTLE